MMDKASEAAAFWGIAENIAYPLDQRLACALKALDFFGKAYEETEAEDHTTATNPNGEVRQCERRDLHESHEYQAEFGALFNVYCPGNNGTKP